MKAHVYVFNQYTLKKFSYFVTCQKKKKIRNLKEHQYFPLIIFNSLEEYHFWRVNKIFNQVAKLRKKNLRKVKNKFERNEIENFIFMNFWKVNKCDDKKIIAYNWIKEEEEEVNKV